MFLAYCMVRTDALVTSGPCLRRPCTCSYAHLRASAQRKSATTVLQETQGRRAWSRAVIPTRFLCPLLGSPSGSVSYRSTYSCTLASCRKASQYRYGGGVGSSYLLRSDPPSAPNQQHACSNPTCHDNSCVYWGGSSRLHYVVWVVVVFVHHSSGSLEQSFCTVGTTDVWAG